MTGSPEEMCATLHEMIKRLEQIQYPFDIKRLPKAGVCFFYENGELWGHGGDGSDGNNLRIVRVGAHCKNNFQSRISDHYIEDLENTLDASKPAPKDRSIFRKNLGRALLNKERNSYLMVWNIDFTTRNARETRSHFRNMKEETSIESEITDLLRKKFSFRFVVLDEESDRFVMESKIIGTLAKCSCCKSSKNWLGMHSPEYKIRKSGLWQTQHVESDGLDKCDIDALCRAVDRTAEWIKGNC